MTITAARDVQRHHRPLEEGDIDLVCWDCRRCFPLGHRWCAWCGSAEIAFNTGEGSV